MSFSAGQSNSNSTATNTLDPQLRDTLYGAVARAQGLADAPFQPYPGQLTAPFAPAQQQAQAALTAIAGDKIGDAPLQSAIRTAQGVAGYVPQTVTAQPLTGVDLSAYRNPYDREVLDAAMADLSRQQQIQDQVSASKATAAGAFGGSRSAVLQSLDHEAFARAAAQTAANLRQAGYAQAQGAAQDDLARAQQAAQANQAAGLQAAGLNLNAAGALAGMGDQQLNQATQRAGALNAAGGAQQQNLQDQLNAAYQQWQLAQQYPLQMQQLLNQTVGLLPQYGTTNSSGSQTDFKLGISGGANGGDSSPLSWFLGG